MYGIIGGIEAVEARRDELGAILAGTGPMPGCLSYVVAADLEDPNLIWVTEIWESEEAHEASLELPVVQDLIARGRPLIAGFKTRHELSPVGGIGLSASS